MKISALKGLGPKSEEMLNDIGLHSASQFMAANPFVIYEKLHRHGFSLNLNLLYAMIGAQEDLHWQHIKATRKHEILLRLDDMDLAPK